MNSANRCAKHIAFGGYGMPAKKIVLSNDPALLAILQNSFFQREGFEMIPVQDGQTGFRAVEAEGPALAVFDLAMMGEQGLECCRKLKGDPLLAATSVMMLLPDQAAEDLADVCWSAGCDAVAHRPMSGERFLDAACGLLGFSRRLATRLPASFEVTFFASEQERHVGRCVNLNTGGMYLATEILFPVGTDLVIEFSLPGSGKPLQSDVRVAWANHPEWRKKNTMPCGLGLQFKNHTPAWKAALQEFLDSLKHFD